MTIEAVAPGGRNDVSLVLKNCLWLAFSVVWRRTITKCGSAVVVKDVRETTLIVPIAWGLFFLKK